MIVLRDQDTIADLQARLTSARRVMIFGNGGIAMELVHALRGVEVLCMAAGLFLWHMGPHDMQHNVPVHALQHNMLVHLLMLHSGICNLSL